MVCRLVVRLSGLTLASFLLAGCVNLQLGRSHSGTGYYDASALRRVRQGDTLEGLANQYGVSPDALAQANNLAPGLEPRPGSLLRIPRLQLAAREARAWPYGSSLRWRAINPVAEASRIIGHAGAPLTRSVANVGYAGRALGAGVAQLAPLSGYPPMIMPVAGTMGRGFNPSTGHKGLDILACEGTPIRAALDGTVVYSDNKLAGYGNLVIMDHGGGLATVYGHNRLNLVRVGARVRRGTVIAEVGQTGNATTPHLHFEVRRGQMPVDPELYLR